MSSAACEACYSSERCPEGARLYAEWEAAIERVRENPLTADTCERARYAYLGHVHLSAAERQA